MSSLCRDCGCEPAAGIPVCGACGSSRIVRHAELHELAIAHLDCDAFYAAIEKRDRPELAEKPVIVGGRHRGVVAACCYLARSYGVRSAMPMFKAIEACPNAVVIAPDMKKYAAVGRQVRAMMEALTPLVEPLSIDEAFLDLAGTEALHGASPAATLARLAGRIEREVEIAVSIGLSYNKFLAKIASDMDKPRGFAVIGRAEAAASLADKPVSLLWGVGEAMRRRLAQDGIRSIGDLARLDEAEAMARYGRAGRRLALASRGLDERRVEPDSEARSLSSEITLARDIAEAARLRPILWQLAETLAARLKARQLAGRTVTLKLKSADFRLVTRSRRLERATGSAEAMFGAAWPLLERCAGGQPFRLIGIAAHDLTAAGEEDQGELFGEGGSGRAEKALDAVRARFGQAALVKGRGFGVRLQKRGPSKTA